MAGQNIRARSALQEQHRQLIEKILSGDMQSGLSVYLSDWWITRRDFQVTQFDLQEGSQLFTLSIQAVSPPRKLILMMC